MATSAHFTILIRPIPRGISRDDLVSHHLLRFGQIKSVRFGEGRGATADVMFIDYFDADAALEAVRTLHGTKDPGTSFLKLHVTLAKSSDDAIKRNIATVSADAAKAEVKNVSQTPPQQTVRVDGAFKVLKSRETGNSICVIDFSALD